jgi:hypothetical protein
MFADRNKTPIRDGERLRPGKPNHRQPPLTERRRDGSNGVVEHWSEELPFNLWQTPLSFVAGHNTKVGFNSVSAIARRVLLIAPLQKQPRFFVTFFVQVMEKGRVSARGELASELVNAGKQWQEGRFWISSSH